MAIEKVSTKQYNLGVIWAALLLVVVGVINLYSATHSDNYPFWKMQSYKFLLGAVLATGNALPT